MDNNTQINDCVEFKKELHEKLYAKSGARNFNEYINYVNSNYSGNKTQQIAAASRLGKMAK